MKAKIRQRPGALKVSPGDVFGHLTVIERSGSDKWGSSIWKCQCDCGKEVIVRGGHLIAGKAKSCGCSRRREGAKKISLKNSTHGMRQSRLYRIWGAMKARCFNPHNNRFDIYGGRGISVCNEWRDHFEPFRDWALSNGYNDNLTIDRKNSDMDYSPDNCRWVTQKTQQNNRRDNHRVTINGETKTISEWGKHYGISPKTITNRIYRGWEAERAITTPIKTRRKEHE